MKETLKAVQRIQLHDKISFEPENKLHFYYSQRRNSGIKSENSPNGCCTHNYLITRAIVKVDIYFQIPIFQGPKIFYQIQQNEQRTQRTEFYAIEYEKSLCASSVEYQMK